MRTGAHEDDRSTRVETDRRTVADLFQGETLAGRFVLQEILGRGGAGTVWSALDTMVGDRVAVKILDASVHDPANRERLRREVRATRSGHPNLVSLHELHEAGGRLFITMELVDGQSLRDALAKRRSLILDDVFAIGRQIAAGLEHLHDKGLVHRDVKPGNIMLSSAGEAKLCDMGLARPLQAGVTVTATEMVVGTPTYMAPELARGELVAASDVYALGLTLYQCLTGEVPLTGTTAVDIFMARQKGRPDRVRGHRPECPRWLGRLLDRMLDPDPDLRPTAAEVARVLEQRQFAWRPHRRHLVRAAALVGFALLAAAAVGLGLRVMGAPPDPADDPVANELMVNAEGFDNGVVYEVTDGHGRSVLTLTTAKPQHPYRTNLFKTRWVAFADLDGDGRRDVVFANPDLSVMEQVEIHMRRPDGSTELADAWNIHHEWEYEGRVFGDFTPSDLECTDLDGDGTPEIILVYGSSPYYLAEVRVFRPDGEEVVRVYHPGQIGNLRTGDRNRDGRREIYVGATNNFHEQNEGNASSPVVFMIDADWSRTGQLLDLLGPGRTLTSRVPAGMDLIYMAFPNQQLIPPVTPWRYAAISVVSAVGSGHFLTVHTDRSNWKNSEKLSFLRAFRFDRDLRLEDGLWVVGPIEERGLDSRTAAPDQLTVSYWNGAAWQPDVCTIPQTGE